MKISPAIKGIITAVSMITIVLVTYYSGLPATSPIQYLVFVIYAIGVVWTLVAYRKSGFFTGKFGDSFSQGFRCFVVVTLLMVAFTGIFSKLHPEFAERSSQLYKQELIKKKDQLPSDIETSVARYKKGYPMALIYGAIFSYLIIGAGVTSVMSAILTRRK